MKYLILLIPFLLIACGEKEAETLSSGGKSFCGPEASFLGDWIAPNDEGMRFKADCTGTHKACAQDFTWETDGQSIFLFYGSNENNPGNVNGCPTTGAYTEWDFTVQDEGTGLRLDNDLGFQQYIYGEWSE